MPIPRGVARFNKRVTNRITGRFAGWMPGFAIVTHTGRRSGRTYRTPVNVFRDGERFLFALTYGAESDWVQNVLAAGRCELRTGGRNFELASPRRFTDPTRRLVPLPARWILALLSVNEFLGLTGSGTEPPTDVRVFGTRSSRRTRAR
jgi:deazaflavin-dependent oxidoreductase (nitroreductase family)